MENNASTLPPNKSRKTAGTYTRRTWKPHEELILMGLLKELVVAGGWKSENGFRPGYLTRLEDMLREKLPDTDLRANPHIQSTVTIWKRHHATIQTALADSGGGFNIGTKILDVSDIAWDKAVKREPTVAAMRYRPWPFYYVWLEVFGNDGATGGSSQTVVDVVNELVEEDAAAEEEVTASHEGVGIEISDDDSGACEMDVESQSPSAEPSKPSVPSTSNKGSSKSSSPPAQQRELLDGLTALFKESDDRLVGVVQSLGFQSTVQPTVQPTSESQPMGLPKAPQPSMTIHSRSDIFAILDTILELDLNDHLDAAEQLTKYDQFWEMFYGLSEYAWGRYVRKMLDGDFD